MKGARPMLDWQGKKWVKVIAISVVVAFLAYDVAWAMDFSPIAITASPSADAPGLIPRIGNFISKSILKRDHKEELPEETEISFRTQLVPRKKYGESSGFQRIDSVKNLIKRQMEQMRRRQQIEEDRRQRDINNYNVNKGLYMDGVEKAQEAQDITEKVMKARGQTFQAAGALSEFSYTKNKDGSTIYYQDGLPSRILDEPIYDSMGNFSLKNTYDMSYDSKRLLTSYDADVTDSFGSVSKIRWRSGRYSSDSVWWAGSDTNAGKYLLGYTEIITDPYGTTIVRDWSTDRSSYGGDKKVLSYNEIVKDATGNILSTTAWSGGTYDGDNLVGYHQESEDAYGNVTVTDWDAEFDGKKMTKAHSIDTQINKDGTTSVSENTTAYTYDASNKAIDALGTTTINGEAQDVNGMTIYTYTGTTTQCYEMINGQLKLSYTTTVMDQDNIDTSSSHTETRFDYIYGSNNLLVDASEISTTTGQDVFGSGYTSATISEYDIISSQPRRVSSDTDSVSETIFGTETASNTHVEYMYDELGNYTGDGATGYTDTTGINLFGEAFSTHTGNKYEIINGQPRLISTQTDPNLINPSLDLGLMLSEIEETLVDIAEAPETKKAEVAQEFGIQQKSIIDITLEAITSIMTWLWKNSTNLINCAIQSLKNLFQGRNIEVKEEELAKDAILIDVLTGVLTPETAKGELMLSMYSIVKTAEKRGLILQGANITIDQLKNITLPVIARLAVEEHFIAITRVTDSEVTYMDNGAEVTEDIIEFSYKWDGNVLAMQLPQDTKVLTVVEMKSIKGSDPSYNDPLKPPLIYDSEGNPVYPLSNPDTGLPYADSNASEQSYLDGTCTWTNNSTWNPDTGSWDVSWSVTWTYTDPITGQPRTENRTYGENDNVPDDPFPNPNPPTHDPEAPLLPEDPGWQPPVAPTPDAWPADNSTLKYSDNSSWQWNTQSGSWEWTQSYSYTWTDADGHEWTYTWGDDVNHGDVEKTSESWEDADGNKYNYTWDGSGRGDDYDAEGGTDATSGFIKEKKYGYIHVSQWSDKGGFDLWRHETNTDFSNKHIEYRTWGEGNPPETESLTIIRGGPGTRGNVWKFGDYKVDFPSSDMSLTVNNQWIYVYNKGEKGSSLIEADNYHNGSDDQTGINEALYYAENTEDDKKTLARIERPSGTETYNIDGLCWEYGGAITTSITLDRKIGGDVGKRQMHIMRNDFQYDFLEVDEIDPWGKEDPWGGCYSWDTVGEESTENLTLGDNADYLKGIKAEWYYDTAFGFWRGLRFTVNEKSEADGGLMADGGLIGSGEGAKHEITIDLDKNWTNYDEDGSSAGVIGINLFQALTTGSDQDQDEDGITYSLGDGVKALLTIKGASGDQTAKVTLTRDVDDGNGGVVTQQIADFEFIIDNTPATRTLRHNLKKVKEAKIAEATDKTSKTLIAIASGSEFEQTVNLVGNRIRVCRRYKGESSFPGVPDSGGPEIILDNIKASSGFSSKELTWITPTTLCTPLPGTVYGKIDNTLGGKTEQGAIGGFTTSFIILASRVGTGPSALSYPTTSSGSWNQPEFTGDHFTKFAPIGAMDSVFTEEPDDPNTYGEINLEWDYYGDPADTMVIERATNSSFTSNIETFSITATIHYKKTYTDQTAERGTTYWYRIRASKGEKPDKLSTPVTAHSYWEPPKEIKDLKAKDRTEGIKLEWRYYGNSEDTFEIWRSTDGKNYTHINVNETNYRKKTYTDEDVEPGKKYYYKVYAVNPDQKKSAAGEDDGVPKFPDANPPRDLSAIATTDTVTLNWTAGQDAVSYEIYLDGKLVATVETTTYTHTGLDPDTNYSFKVVSLNGDDNSVDGADAAINVTTEPLDLIAAASEGADEAVYEELAPTVIEGVEKGLLANLATLAKNLGLTLEGAKAKVTQIIDWLKAMGSLVINCASRALYKVLNALGINTSQEEIAIESILIDFINGIITPESSSILYTSFYAIEEVALDKGIDLELYSWTIDELSQITSPVIAHINWDHAVVVTKVENGIVSFIDSDGKLYQESISEFSGKWTGYVLAPKVSEEPEEPEVPEVREPVTPFAPPVPRTPVTEEEFEYPYLPFISVDMAQRIVERVAKELEFRQQFLGPGINNFIENAGGLKKIVDWLNKMGTYVVNCASKALYNILVRLGVKTSLEDLAVETILSDLAAGIIKPGQTPILYTSFYTLHKVAFTKGIDLKLYNVTVDELKTVECPVIAEAGQNHAVVITKIENDRIYLLEADGKLYDLSIEEFTRDFQGFILSQRGPPEKEELTITPDIMTSGEPLPPIQEPFLPPPPPAESWDEGSKHWTSITTIGIDGSYTRTDSWIEYEYNQNGQLIGAKGGGTTWGEDVFGNIYISKRTDVYAIIAGEAKVIYSISITNSTNLDGSINTSIGMMHYIYDAAGVIIGADGEGTVSFEKFTLDEGQLDEDDLDYIKTWVTDGDFPDHLSLVDTDGDGTNDALEVLASNLTIGEDVFGNPFKSVTINTYEIIGGEAKVTTTVTTTDATAFDGVITNSINTVSYDYTDGTEPREELPDTYFNSDGTLKEKYTDSDTDWIMQGLIKNADSATVVNGIDVFGNT
nr:hypothetical protein [Candidatus Omnitrophota bacterium]